MDKYPAIRLLLRFKSTVPFATAALALLIGAFLSIRAGSADGLVIGIVVAATMFLAVKVFVELVAIVVDTLLPQV